MKHINMKHIKLIPLLSVLIFQSSTNALPKYIIDKMDQIEYSWDSTIKPYITQTFQLIKAAECFDHSIPVARIAACFDTMSGVASNFIPEGLISLLNIQDEKEKEALKLELNKEQDIQKKWRLFLGKFIFYIGHMETDQKINNIIKEFAEAINNAKSIVWLDKCFGNNIQTAFDKLITLESILLSNDAILINSTSNNITAKSEPLYTHQPVTQDNLVEKINLLYEKRELLIKTQKDAANTIHSNKLKALEEKHAAEKAALEARIAKDAKLAEHKDTHLELLAFKQLKAIDQLIADKNNIENEENQTTASSKSSSKLPSNPTNPDRLLLLITEYQLLLDLLNQNLDKRIFWACAALLGITGVITTAALSAGGVILGAHEYLRTHPSTAESLNNALTYFTKIKENQTNALATFLNGNCTSGCTPPEFVTSTTSTSVFSPSSTTIWVTAAPTT